MRPTEVQGTGKQSGRKTGKRPLRPVEDYKDYTLHSLRIPRSAFDLREIRHLMHRRAHAGEEVEAGRALDLVRIIEGHLVEKRIHGATHARQRRHRPFATLPLHPPPGEHLGAAPRDTRGYF